MAAGIIISNANIHYLEVQKVLSRDFDADFAELPKFVEKTNLVAMDAIINGATVYILVSDGSDEGEITRKIIVDGENHDNVLKMTNALVETFGGRASMDKSSWTTQQATRNRPVMSPREALAITLTATIGFQKAQTIYQIADNAEALAALGQALHAFNEEVTLITDLQLDDPEAPELIGYGDGTAGQKAVWVLVNSTNQTVELTCRLPETTFEARIYEVDAPFRQATAHEVELIKGKIPEAHFALVKDWHEAFQADKTSGLSNLER